jgi:hypothetical protein
VPTSMGSAAVLKAAPGQSRRLDRGTCSDGTEHASSSTRPEAEPATTTAAVIQAMGHAHEGYGQVHQCAHMCQHNKLCCAGEALYRQACIQR